MKLTIFAPIEIEVESHQDIKELQQALRESNVSVDCRGETSWRFKIRADKVSLASILKAYTSARGGQ